MFEKEKEHQCGWIERAEETAAENEVRKAHWSGKKPFMYILEQLPWIILC